MFEAHNRLEDEEYPGDHVEEEVEPVDWAHELPFQEHLELLDDMGRSEGCEAQSDAKHHDDRPGNLRQ